MAWKKGFKEPVGDLFDKKQIWMYLYSTITVNSMFCLSMFVISGEIIVYYAGNLTYVCFILALVLVALYVINLYRFLPYGIPHGGLFIVLRRFFNAKTSHVVAILNLLSINAIIIVIAHSVSNYVEAATDGQIQRTMADIVTKFNLYSQPTEILSTYTRIFAALIFLASLIFILRPLTFLHQIAMALCFALTYVLVLTCLLFHSSGGKRTFVATIPYDMNALQEGVAISLFAFYGYDAYFYAIRKDQKEHKELSTCLIPTIFPLIVMLSLLIVLAIVLTSNNLWPLIDPEVTIFSAYIIRNDRYYLKQLSMLFIIVSLSLTSVYWMRQLVHFTQILFTDEIYKFPVPQLSISVQTKLLDKLLYVTIIIVATIFVEPHILIAFVITNLLIFAMIIAFASINVDLMCSINPNQKTYKFDSLSSTYNSTNKRKNKNQNAIDSSDETFADWRGNVNTSNNANQFLSIDSTTKLSDSQILDLELNKFYTRTNYVNSSDIESNIRKEESYLSYQDGSDISNGESEYSRKNGNDYFEIRNDESFDITALDDDGYLPNITNMNQNRNNNNNKRRGSKRNSGKNSRDSSSRQSSQRCSSSREQKDQDARNVRIVHLCIISYILIIAIYQYFSETLAKLMPLFIIIPAALCVVVLWKLDQLNKQTKSSQSKSKITPVSASVLFAMIVLGANTYFLTKIYWRHLLTYLIVVLLCYLRFLLNFDRLNQLFKIIEHVKHSADKEETKYNSSKPTSKSVDSRSSDMSSETGKRARDKQRCCYGRSSKEEKKKKCKEKKKAAEKKKKEKEKAKKAKEKEKEKQKANKKQKDKQKGKDKKKGGKNKKGKRDDYSTGGYGDSSDSSGDTSYHVETDKKKSGKKTYNVRRIKKYYVDSPHSGTQTGVESGHEKGRKRKKPSKKHKKHQKKHHRKRKRSPTMTNTTNDGHEGNTDKEAIEISVNEEEQEERQYYLVPTDTPNRTPEVHEKPKKKKHPKRSLSSTTVESGAKVSGSFQATQADTIKKYGQYNVQTIYSKQKSGNNNEEGNKQRVKIINKTSTAAQTWNYNNSMMKPLSGEPTTFNNQNNRRCISLERNEFDLPIQPNRLNTLPTSGSQKDMAAQTLPLAKNELKFYSQLMNTSIDKEKNKLNFQSLINMQNPILDKGKPIKSHMLPINLHAINESSKLNRTLMESLNKSQKKADDCIVLRIDLPMSSIANRPDNLTIPRNIIRPKYLGLPPGLTNDKIFDNFSKRNNEYLTTKKETDLLMKELKQISNSSLNSSFMNENFDDNISVDTDLLAKCQTSENDVMVIDGKDLNSDLTETSHNTRTLSETSLDSFVLLRSNR
ncbi:hypothetical protein SNEBB_003121 [Seison nebaliae]|nr:hypothetical protein SNEBB_003121 [Seison nebaliae]